MQSWSPPPMFLSGFMAVVRSNSTDPWLYRVWFFQAAMVKKVSPQFARTHAYGCISSSLWLLCVFVLGQKRLLM